VLGPDICGLSGKYVALFRNYVNAATAVDMKDTRHRSKQGGGGGGYDHV
jgi:hypothetical protein